MIGPTLRQVGTADLDHLWPIVRPILARACAPAPFGDAAPEDYLPALRDCRSQLWVAWRPPMRIDGALVTSIEQHRTGQKTCRLALVAGAEMTAWLPLMPQLEEWALAQGCVRMEAKDGRPGWQRVMRGWRLKTITLERML